MKKIQLKRLQELVELENNSVTQFAAGLNVEAATAYMWLKANMLPLQYWPLLEKKYNVDPMSLYAIFKENQEGK